MKVLSGLQWLKRRSLQGFLLSPLEIGCVFFAGLSLALGSNHPILFGFVLSCCLLVLVLHFILEWKRAEASRQAHAIINLGRDPATGLPSTLLFEGVLAHLAAISNRYQHPFSVIAFEIVSEGKGVALDQPDEVLLRELAWGVVDCVRVPDSVCRWTQSRFMVLLPETSAEDAETLAQRIGTFSAGLCQAKNYASTFVYGIGIHLPGSDPMAALTSAEKNLEAQWLKSPDANTPQMAQPTKI